MEADVILHVRDVSHAESEAQAQDVLHVLDELGIDDTKRSHLIEVWNKSDLLEPLEHAKLEASAARRDDCVLVSAIDGSGLEPLLGRVEVMVGQAADIYAVTLDAGDGKGLAWLHRRGEVLERKNLKDTRLKVLVRLDMDKAGQAHALFGKNLRKQKSAG